MYNDFQNYVIKRAFLQCYSEEDINRIKGFGRDVHFNFAVEDINNPTAEEVKAFEKFSPAQQVFWVKRHVQPGRGLLFDLLEVSLFNRYNVRGDNCYQTIKYRADGVNKETALSMCGLTYAIDNPLIQTALKGLVEYAMVVENFSMKRNGITTIIKNDIIRDYGILESVDITKRGVLDTLFESNSTEYLSNSLYTNYVRSHSRKIRRQFGIRK